jgi:hypothetical protein
LEAVRAQALDRRVVVVYHDGEVTLGRNDRVVAVQQVDLRPAALDPRGHLGERARWVDRAEAEQLVERDTRGDPMALDLDGDVLERQSPSG